MEKRAVLCTCFWRTIYGSPSSAPRGLRLDSFAESGAFH